MNLGKYGGEYLTANGLVISLAAMECEAPNLRVRGVCIDSAKSLNGTNPKRLAVDQKIYRIG